MIARNRVCARDNNQYLPSMDINDSVCSSLNISKEDATSASVSLSEEDVDITDVIFDESDTTSLWDSFAESLFTTSSSSSDEEDEEACSVSSLVNPCTTA